MSSKLPSIREQLLRIHLMVACVAVMGFFAFCCVTEWKYTRALLSANFASDMEAAAEGSAGYLQAHDLKGLEVHLRDFHSLPGMAALCVYNADNKIVAAWRADWSGEGCPQFVLREGMEKSWLEATTAIALNKNKTYVGMLYAHSRLTDWRTILLQDASALAVALLAAYLACRFSSRYGARAITASLAALRSQIDCLKNDDYTVCTLLPPMTTVETASLAASVTEFRAHLALETLPRTEIKQVHRWYGHVFSGLLHTLRAQVEADSPLLQHMNDYEQLLRLEAGAKPVPPTVFDIAKLLRSTVQAVRAQFPEDPRVPLSVTLQSSMQHEWFGQPEMLRSMVQHLLLIALRRTRQGAVCLRLAIEQNAAQPLQLAIKLEDSGPPLQRWQLLHWLGGMQDSAHDDMADISWLMVSRLLRALGGTAQADMDPNGGLIFTASLPIARPHAAPLVQLPTLPVPALQRVEAEQPLLLLVEASPEKRALLRRLFASLHCRIFLVDDHAQAMAWAPVLPFSALVLNGTLPDARAMVVRRLHHLAEEELMPLIPLWAMVTSLSAADEEHWLQAGVSALLTQPLSRAVLEPLCAHLAAPDGGFYLAYDAPLQQDFPASIVQRLPELSREIARQVRQLHAQLLALPEGDEQALREQVHAVKSASLTLGYFRLAGLMAEIEHALLNHAFREAPHQWQLIAHCLDAEMFDYQPQRASA